MFLELPITVDDKAIDLITRMAEYEYYEWISSSYFYHQEFADQLVNEIQMIQSEQAVIERASVHNWIHEQAEGTFILTNIGRIEALMDQDRIDSIHNSCTTDPDSPEGAESL